MQNKSNETEMRCLGFFFYDHAFIKQQMGGEYDIRPDFASQHDILKCYKCL